MSFKSDERQRQLLWKAHTTTLSAAARVPGIYTGRSNGSRTRDDMFLHEAHSEENLLPQIRAEALAMFRQYGIDWHDGPPGLPSNYLMCSMVSCMNCLLPFAHDGAALAALLRPLVPGAIDALAVEDGRVLSFEWMGVDNPLKETSPNRRRGRCGTSVDAFCALGRSDGGRTGVLIEWKYTESYPEEKASFGDHYLPLLEAPDGPIDVARCGGARALLVEPIYQLARLQLLAHETERAQSLGCDRAVVVAVVPTGNRDYRTHIPGAALRARHHRIDVGALWTSLLRRSDRFVLTSFDELLAAFRDDLFPALAPAVHEVRSRYGPSHAERVHQVGGPNGVI